MSRGSGGVGEWGSGRRPGGMAIANRVLSNVLDGEVSGVPELPEVETIKNDLRSLVVGRRVEDVHVLHPRW